MWEPRTIVFGVRHKKRFSFLDNAGEVIDSVIEMQEAGELPSGVKFENVGWQKTLARLQDAKAGVTLDLDVDGIVLTVNASRSSLRRESTKRLLVTLAPQILRITGGDDRVDRIGALEQYTFTHESSGEVALTALTNLSNLGTGTDITMRVSFRGPTEDGLVSREIQDWRNTILQVWNRAGDTSEVDLKQLNVSIDFQTYFVPERQYSSNLIEDHYRRFLERLEQLQTGRLAGLAGDQQLTR